MLSDPKIGGIKSRTLDMMVPAAWVLPAVTVLVVIIVCRRPARRQVYWLRESINAAAILGILAGELARPADDAPAGVPRRVGRRRREGRHAARADRGRLIQVIDDIDALARSIRIVPLAEEGLDPSFTPA